MHRVIIAPDKFKGSLNSFELCEHLKRAVSRQYPNAAVSTFPLADGGDGFTEVVKHYLNTETITASTIDAVGNPISGKFEWAAKDHVAYIGLSVASGIANLNSYLPMQANTIGTGRLVQRAIKLGARKIVLGAGGSATTDAGTGMLSALGFRFMDKEGNELNPCGGSLLMMHSIVAPPAVPSLEWVIAADVDNPMHGPDGAAFVFAPQKGATDQEVLLLDSGLRNFARLISGITGHDIASEKGMGAAGAIAAGLSAFFPLTIRSGADLLIEYSGISSALPGASLLITGEGKFDTQSLGGKLVMKIAREASRHAVPVLVVCGELSVDEGTLASSRIHATAIRRPGMSLDDSIARAAELVESIDLQTILT